MIFSFLPNKVNDAYAPELLNPDEAVTMAWVDVEVSRSAVTRGKGMVRVDFTTGLSNNVFAAGVARRRDGAVLLLYQDEGGSVYMQPNVRPGFTDAQY